MTSVWTPKRDIDSIMITAMAEDKNGDLVVPDLANWTIRIFGENGLKSNIGSYGLLEDQFSGRLLGIAVDSKNNKIALSLGYLNNNDLVFAMSGNISASDFIERLFNGHLYPSSQIMKFDEDGK